ncbi:MAG: alanine racemase [Bacteroidota bacterium]|nr:alanine racemase [Bacteroidota bacterium]MDP4193578.1 alanine racemase [Bacteroidota bacterium]
MRPTLAKISYSNLKFNYLNIRKKVKKARVMAVVKADAYGHGMINCVSALNTLGDKKPDYFAVALLEEAIELRKSKVKQPVLTFAPVGPDEAALYIKHDVIPTIFETYHLEMLKAAKTKSKKIKVHVKIDTGMGRLGVPYSEAVDFISKVASKGAFEVDGIYTHFATSDEKDKTYAELQLSRFKSIVDSLKNNGISFGLAHAANSGAILDMPEAYFDMVRPGISLYGYYPSLETSESIKLKPVMSLVSKITNVKEVQKGDSISYGRRFIADKPTKIATVPVGYADGYARALTNKTFAIIKGQKYSQVGQVCMDRIMIDINEARIKENDEVILLGKKNNLEINAWDWAKILNTIPYEITCNISKRVPRVYVE